MTQSVDKREVEPMPACQRCHGCLVTTTVYDMFDAATIFRCINCGDMTDRTTITNKICQNRRQVEVMAKGKYQIRGPRGSRGPYKKGSHDLEILVPIVGNRAHGQVEEAVA